MKLTTTITLCFFALHISFGQTSVDTSDILKRLSLLEEKAFRLEKENTTFKAEQRTTDSIVYTNVRSQIFEAITATPQLDFDFKIVSDKIDVSGLFTKLMDANNPRSDVLGFEFTDVVVNAAKKNFLGELPKEDKPRFASIVDKIVTNPVASSIIKSNPITSVVSSVISSIANFSSTKCVITKDGRTIKNVVAETTDVFDQKKIEKFKEELQPYMDFYDEMILASEVYRIGLDNLNKQYSYIDKDTESYSKDLLKSLGVKNMENPLLEVTTLLPEPRPELKYKEIMTNLSIQNALGIANRLPIVQNSVNDFKKDYNALLTNFLNSYIRLLGTAKKFPKNEIDGTKIDALIAEIEAFKIKVKGDAGIDAFK